MTKKKIYPLNVQVFIIHKTENKQANKGIVEGRIGKGLPSDLDSEL